MENCYAVTVKATEGLGVGDFEKTEYVSAQSPEEAEQKVRRDYSLSDAIINEVVSVTIVRE